MHEWCTVRLGDLVNINSSTYTSDMSWKYVNYLDTGNLTEDTIYNVQHIDLEREGLPSRARRLVRRNSILYSTVRPIQRHYGIIKDQPPNFLVSTGFAVIDVKEELADPYFIYFYLIQDSIIERLQRLAEQSVTAYPSITSSDIENLQIKLPSLRVQRRIANLLKNISDKITLNASINHSLEQQFKTMYDYWFTQFDFPNETGNPYQANGGEMVWNDDLKRKIPADWEVIPLRQMMQKNNIAFDCLSEQPTLDLSVMPSDSICLDTLNTSSNFSTNLYVMKKGDILFGSIRPYLHKAGFAPCDGAVAGTVHSFHVLDESYYNFVLFTVSRSSFFDYAVNVSAGTKMPVVNSDYILDYKIPYSPSVVKKFNEVSVMEIISHNIMESLELTKMRDLLLPLILNGHVSIMD